jgi:hypothetical protein
MSDMYADVMDDLMDEAAEGPARSAYDEADEYDEWDAGDFADEGDEGDDEFLSRIVSGIGQAVGGLLGADEGDEYDEYDSYDEGDAYAEGAEFDEYADAESFEDAVADALDAGDSDEFLRRLRGFAGRALNVARRVGRGVGQVARVVGPLASMIPIPQAQAIGRIANIAGRLLADGADEFETIDELVDGYDDDAIDAAAPIIAGLTIRRAMPGAARLPRQARRQLVRSVSQATRTLVRRQGAPAARAVTRIVRSTQRAVARRRLPARRVPQAVRRATQRVVRSPAAVRRLARPLVRPSARVVRRGGAVAGGAVARGAGLAPSPYRGGRRYPRQITLRGPVTITIRGQ